MRTSLLLVVMCAILRESSQVFKTPNMTLRCYTEVHNKQTEKLTCYDENRQKIIRYSTNIWTCHAEKKTSKMFSEICVDKKGQEKKFTRPMATFY